MLEVKVSPTSLTGSLTPGTGYDAASIIYSSTRSRRWAYHSVRQGSSCRDWSESKYYSRSQGLSTSHPWSSSLRERHALLRR